MGLLSNPWLINRPNKHANTTYIGGTSHSEYLTEPVTKDAKKWNGYSTQLKPACDLIALCRKPLCGTIQDNLREWECGALAVHLSRSEIGGFPYGRWSSMSRGGLRSSRLPP